jgi:molecular chaperone DnaK
MSGKILGIDLGTTNSLVSWYNGSESVVIEDQFGKITPSVVSFLDNKAAIVGQRAKELQAANSERTVYSVKRFMGKSPDEIKETIEHLPYKIDVSADDIVRIDIDGMQMTPSEISAKILANLKQKAEKHFHENITDCVITVPAYFNDAERQATYYAGKMAGLNVRKIINEPTAAALAYGLDKKEKSTIVVYDFGGGTFDVSVLKLSEGIFEVLSTNGDTQLGGDDIDRTLIKLFKEKLGLDDHQCAIAEIYEYLRQTAVETKIQLTNHDELELNLRVQKLNVEKNIKISRDEFNKLIKPIIKKTKSKVKKALKDAGLDFNDIDEIVMVGGSTRVPHVREEVENWFEKKPHTEIDPDEVVAVGAGIQGAIISGDLINTVLLDVTPLSLGMETYGGVVHKFILRNTKIPCYAIETFTTQVDNQTGVSVNVLQGEREFAKDNISLGKFSLKGIEPAAAGVPRIEVKFQIDANGILRVTAKDEKTGNNQHIEVRPHTGLTDEIVEKFLHDSLKNMKEDMETRFLQDVRTEAEAVIIATNRALKENNHLINDELKNELNIAIEMLENAMKKTDKKLIQGLTENLDRESKKFAEIIMNSTIKTVLRDENINKFLK